MTPTMMDQKAENEKGVGSIGIVRALGRKRVDGRLRPAGQTGTSRTPASNTTPNISKHWLSEGYPRTAVMQSRTTEGSMGICWPVCPHRRRRIHRSFLWRPGLELKHVGCWATSLGIAYKVTGVLVLDVIHERRSALTA